MNVFRQTHQDGADFYALVNDATEPKLVFSDPRGVPDGDMDRAREARSLFLEAMADRSIKVEWEPTTMATETANSLSRSSVSQIERFLEKSSYYPDLMSAEECQVLADTAAGLRTILSWQSGR